MGFNRRRFKGQRGWASSRRTSRSVCQSSSSRIVCFCFDKWSSYINTAAQL